VTVARARTIARPDGIRALFETARADWTAGGFPQHATTIEEWTALGCRGVIGWEREEEAIIVAHLRSIDVMQPGETLRDCQLRLGRERAFALGHYT
jgi:hypothetical protein